MTSYLYCPKCGFALPKQANFCPGCGAKIAGGSSTLPRLTTRQILMVVAVAFLIWFPAWSYQGWKAGVKPTKTFEAASGHATTGSGSPAAESPELERLRVALSKNPENLDAQQELAAALVDQLRTDENPPQELVFEAIEVLSKIIKNHPNDTDALIALADITFNQQVFAKSADYYARYLKAQPNDFNVRARYGSSLAFSGKFDDAIRELNVVLEKDPKNFNAAAYLAITYAQMGDSVKALKAGEKALPLAPNDDARARFAQFIDEVRTGPKKESPERGNIPKTESSDKESGKNPALALLENSIATNPVAGPKFVSAEIGEAGLIKLYFRDFPMEGMPPFVREKFVNAVKLKAQGVPGAKFIAFVDKASGKEMVKVPVG